MDSPRKKIKTSPSQIDAVPQSPATDVVIQVPASSPIVDQSSSSNHKGISSPSTNGNGKQLKNTHSSDDEVKAYDVNPKESSGALAANGRQLHSMRKAEFPSQQKMHNQAHTTAPLPARSSSQTSNTSAPFSPGAYPASASPGIQQMRQHVQTFQYNPAVGSNQVQNAQYTHSAQTMQNPYPQVGYPSTQFPQQFYPGRAPTSTAPYQQQPLPANSASMAEQYSAGRSRPLLVQRGSAQTQYQAPPGHYPPLQHNPHSAYPMQQIPYQQGYPAANPYMHQQQQRPQAPPVDPSAIMKLSEVFPHLPDAILRKAIIQARGNVDDAQALIADDRVTIDLTENSAPQSQAIYGVPQVYSPHGMGGMPPQPQRHLPTSTKREVKAPNLSIREKQALRTARTYPGQYTYQNPYVMQQQQHPYAHPQQLRQHQQQQHLYHLQHQQQLLQHQQWRSQQIPKRSTVPAPAYEAPKLRTRVAKKGPKIDIGSDESEDDAVVELDSEGQDETDLDSDDDQDADAVVGVHLDFDRVALESRVLYYLNSVETAKELADLAACTEDTAEFIISSRPFSDLEAVKNLDQLPEGKRPSRTRKTVGTKVVEVSIESMEGYEAIDNLVERCEDYGKTVKEAMNQWGIDVDLADDKDGALDVVTIDAEKAASKSSDTLYLKDQPALLPEGMLLKDYQLWVTGNHVMETSDVHRFGVNWLHLMYQKKLSGILADEVGHPQYECL